MVKSIFRGKKPIQSFHTTEHVYTHIIWYLINCNTAIPGITREYNFLQKPYTTDKKLNNSTIKITFNRAKYSSITYLNKCVEAIKNLKIFYYNYRKGVPIINNYCKRIV